LIWQYHLTINFFSGSFLIEESEKKATTSGLDIYAQATRFFTLFGKEIYIGPQLRSLPRWAFSEDEIIQKQVTFLNGVAGFEKKIRENYLLQLELAMGPEIGHWGDSLTIFPRVNIHYKDNWILRFDY